MKYCNKCSSSKPLSDFGRDKYKRDGLMSICKACNCAKTRAYTQANPDKVKRYFAERNEKLRNSRPRKDPLPPWRLRNPERQKELLRSYYLLNRESIRQKQREYYSENKDKFISYLRKARLCGGSDYRAKRAMCSARRRARIIQAIPLWFSQSACDEIYLLAERLTRETGVKHEVDHIVPVRSKVVCGLHWHGNMRVLTKAENSAKGNRHWPDMP